MLCYPCMLEQAAQEAGIPVPPDVSSMEEIEKTKENYPHFYVFCLMQLNRRMDVGEHWGNAKIIASFSEEEIKKISPDDLEEKGFRI